MKEHTFLNLRRHFMLEVEILIRECVITFACCSLLCRPRSLARLCFKPVKVRQQTYQLFYEVKVITKENIKQ